MTDTPTYKFYTDEFGGELTGEQFEAALPEAVASVNYEIFPRAPKSDKEKTAYMNAVCAAVDYVDDPPVGSWRVGSTSETLLDSKRNTLRSTIKRQLIGTNLICKAL